MGQRTRRDLGRGVGLQRARTLHVSFTGCSSEYFIITYNELLNEGMPIRSPESGLLSNTQLGMRETHVLMRQEMLL